MKVFKDPTLLLRTFSRKHFERTSGECNFRVTNSWIAGTPQVLFRATSRWIAGAPQFRVTGSWFAGTP